MRQRESRYYIDLKQIFIERSQIAKNEALTTFICSCVKDASEKSTPLDDQQVSHLNIYVRDYVSVLLQKKSLLQKELKDILFDSMICLKAVIPTLPELPAYKSKESEDYESIVKKNLSLVQGLYHLKNGIKEDLKRVFESPYEYKFFYQTKYPYKEQILRSIVEKELPEILSDLGFQRFSSMGNKDYIVTAEPRAGGFLKLNLIYYSSSNIPIFRKLTFENEMSGFNVGAEISCLTQLPGTIGFIREAEERPRGSEKPVRIGYIFDHRKFTRLQADEILTSRYPVEFVPIDLRVPLNREINGFVHKITNTMKNKDDPFSAIKLHHFEQISKRGDIKLFDPMDSLNILSNRDTFQNFVGEIFKTKEFLDEITKLQDATHHYVFDIPKACFVDPNKSSPSDVLETVKKEGMKYPIIVKTATAGVDKNSHKMAVALNENGLKQIESSERFREYTHILQEYIEHDERIYKVYAIGNEVATEQKQSLPNLLDRNLDIDCFYFDSQASIKQDPIFSKLIQGFKPLDINEEMVKAMYRIINKEIKLSLVGFDLIKGKNTGAYYLVDINYFPSCKPFKDFRSVIHKMFHERCSNNL